MGLFTKRSTAILTYTEEYATLLGADTIATSTWIVPGGITSDAETDDADTTTITLSGGTDGEDYFLRNHIVTAAGLEDDRYLTILVRDPAT